jgi:hypothetical protein
MRKFVYGGVAACLVVGAIGAYLATHTGAELVPSFAEEEQEPPNAIPFPVGDLVYHASSDKEEPESEDEVNFLQSLVNRQGPADLSQQVESSAPPEPIVVAALAPELPRVTEVGGAAAPGEGLGNGVVVVQSAPRPDEERGQERTMPYVADKNGASWLADRLWAALCRVLTGEAPPAAGSEETQEPPVAVTEPAAPPKPETLPPLFPQGMDHH